MSIVTFWGTGKEQVGKTLAVVALATNMAIEYNKKILVISASYNNDTIKKCYWNEESTKKTAMFKSEVGVELGNGIDGLAKIIQSNKVAPESITDYTKVVFKDRLEVLLGYEQNTSTTSEQVGKIYSELVQIASRYYDMVFVDLDNEINIAWSEEILKKSDLIVAMTSQKISSIKKMMEKKATLPNGKSMLLIGRYDKNSKYTLKNLARTLGERRELLAIPYNTLYFEASQEGTTADLFLRLRRLEDKNDDNIFFIESVKKVTEEIVKKIQEDKLMNREGR